jgi:hypothetical protein
LAVALVLALKLFEDEDEKSAPPRLAKTKNATPSRVWRLEKCG